MLVVAVLVLVAGGITAGSLAFALSTNSDQGTFLDQSTVPLASPGSYYTQKYLRNVAFFSTPQFTNSANTNLTDLSASLLVRGPCKVRVLFHRTYQANSGERGYVPGGSGPAQRLIEPWLHLRQGKPLQEMVFGPNSGSGWFDTITFRVPGFCEARIKGFETSYLVAGKRYHEFLPDPAVFYPSSKL